MKKMRIFVSAGIFALAIIGAVAFKTDAKRTTVYYKSGISCLSETFTPCTAGSNACLDGSSRQIYANSNCTGAYTKQ